LEFLRELLERTRLGRSEGNRIHSFNIEADDILSAIWYRSITVDVWRGISYVGFSNSRVDLGSIFVDYNDQLKGFYYFIETLIWQWICYIDWFGWRFFCESLDQTWKQLIFKTKAGPSCPIFAIPNNCKSLQERQWM
jgi:hypothetical protein